ncbi:hypothetical protein PG994_004097 [Apiospora phragmitis]|uniref:Clr5 domain-containing protein n=1 Tax=Apiospora phragmitis TaxID=2905665 RepID=A0ABR1VPM3_9PEZI
MARKATKKGRKAPNRTIWDIFKDEVPLLAWLDYCIQHGVDFDSTVVDHLRTYANKEVRLGQVDGKLKSLFGTWGHCKKFDEFKHRQGSPAIGLSDIEREAVRRFKESLPPPPPTRPDAEYQLQGITPGLRTRSQTLSAPRQASEDSSLSDLSSITDPDDCSDANVRSKTVEPSERFARSKVSSAFLRSTLEQHLSLRTRRSGVSGSQTQSNRRLWRALIHDRKRCPT